MTTNELVQAIKDIDMRHLYHAAVHALHGLAARYDDETIPSPESIGRDLSSLGSLGHIIYTIEVFKITNGCYRDRDGQ